MLFLFCWFLNCCVSGKWRKFVYVSGVFEVTKYVLLFNGLSDKSWVYLMKYNCLKEFFFLKGKIDSSRVVYWNRNNSNTCSLLPEPLLFHCEEKGGCLAYCCAVITTNKACLHLCSTLKKNTIHTVEQQVKAETGLEVLKYSFSIISTLIAICTFSQLWNQSAANVKWKCLMRYYGTLRYSNKS